MLFTEPVTGPTLANLLLTHPEDAAELLAAPFTELTELHKPDSTRRLDTSGAITERSVAGTFLRKFDGACGVSYTNRLGVERCSEAEHLAVVELLQPTISRLRRIALMTRPSVPPVLVYGELKPEHVFFPEGAQGRPTFVDPGLMRAGASADVAKLVSRTVLLVGMARPSSDLATRIAQGVNTLVQARASTLPRSARSEWLREVFTLWLMDSVNITSTYLAAPAGMPLPAQGAAVVERATAVCRLFKEMSADIAVEGDANGLWERALARVEKVGR